MFAASKNSGSLLQESFEILFGLTLLIKRPSQWQKNKINLSLLAISPANIYMAVKKSPLGDKTIYQHGNYI